MRWTWRRSSRPTYGRIMVPKAEDPEAIAQLDRYEVIALCETARGVLRAPAIAEVPCVVALMWGAEDLIVSLGGRSSRNDDGSYLGVALVARSTVLIAAGAANKPTIDAVYLDINDERGLAVEASGAAASGFTSKACIHPRQVIHVREAFQPTAKQISWARKGRKSRNGRRCPHSRWLHGGRAPSATGPPDPRVSRLTG